MTAGEEVSYETRLAFGDYVRRRGGALFRVAMSLTGNNRADAEDLVQATLVKTYLSWDRIADAAALDTYVRRVMVNTHISGWRRRRVDEYPTDELPDEPTDDQIAECDLHEVMQAALDRLPRRMRAAVMLRYYDDMSEPEVARALGISVGTVKSTVARAVAKLRADSDLRADLLITGGLLRGLGPWHYHPKAFHGFHEEVRCGVDSTMMDIPLTVGAIMRYGSTAFGDAEVVTCTGEDGSARRRTFAEVGRRSARLANALRGLGVDGDQRVGTFMWNNAEHLEVYLAVPAMGAVLHTLNIRLPADQVGYIATHAEDHAVVVDASLVPLFAAVLPHAPTVRHVLVSGVPSLDDATRDSLTGAGVTVHSYEDLLAAADDSFPWPDVDERSAAAMCYTSGTTGLPKGVVYSHRSTYLHSMAPCLGNAFALSEQDRVMPVVPMFHANAWGLAYAALLAGASLVLPDRFMQPAALVNLVSREKVTLGAGVPTIWAGVLAVLRSGPGASDALASITRLVCGGSALPEAIMRGFESEFGVRMIHAWGMTETSPLGSIAHAPAGVTGEEAWEYRTSQGRLFCALEGRLVGDSDEVMPSDGKAVGEIEVRGPWVTGSYYKDPAPDKFHDGWLRTGDVGTLDPAGFIRLTDRAKDVIKSGGEWISSMELENLLMAHPSVAEAAVIGVSDEKWGERPLAAVVPVAGASVTPDELRTFLASKLPRWQLPERWTFITEVPKTSVGKFQKTKLRDLYANGSLDVTTLGAPPK